LLTLQEMLESSAGKDGDGEDGDGEDDDNEVAAH
jgi:hypothetical protein